MTLLPKRHNRQEVIGQLDKVVSLKIAETTIDPDYGSETITYVTGAPQFANVSYDVGRFGLSGEKEDSGRQIGYTSSVFTVRAFGNDAFKNKKNKVLYADTLYDIKRVTASGTNTDELLHVFCESQE